MLKPAQLRHLTTLVLFLLVAVGMIVWFTYRQEIRLRDAASARPPAVENAPPPPPSPFPPGSVPFGGILRGVEDHGALSDLEKDPAYRKLLEHAITLPEENFRSSSEGTLHYATFLKYAGELRGRIFRVRAEAIEPATIVRLAEPVQGREDVHRLFLFQQEDEGGFFCDVAEPPEKLQQRDDVELEGLFLKLIRFEHRPGKGAREAPFFIARSVRRIAPVAPPAPDSDGVGFALKLAMGVAIAGVLVGAWFMLQRQRRPALVRPVSRRHLHRGDLPKIPPEPGPPSG